MYKIYQDVHHQSSGKKPYSLHFTSVASRPDPHSFLFFSLSSIFHASLFYTWPSSSCFKKKKTKINENLRVFIVWILLLFCFFFLCFCVFVCVCVFNCKLFLFCSNVWGLCCEIQGFTYPLLSLLLSLWFSLSHSRSHSLCPQVFYCALLTQSHPLIDSLSSSRSPNYKSFFPLIFNPNFSILLLLSMIPNFLFLFFFFLTSICFNFSFLFPKINKKIVFENQAYRFAF